MKSQTTSDGAVEPGATFAEIGTIEHESRQFSAGGAYVDDAQLIAYLSKNGTVTTWNGDIIGRYRVTSNWRTPRSYISDRMYQVIITLSDGRSYTGRGAGEGMSIRAKRIAAQRKGGR